MGMIWYRNYKADKKFDDYMVTGFRLYDDKYYGEHGMMDFPTELPLDEYRLDVNSWGKDPYGHVWAGDPWSDIMMSKEFTDKTEANMMWKKIVDQHPSWEDLENMGFKRL